MDTPPSNSLEEIFAHAKLLLPADQASWLDAACAGQPELRAEVEALLRSHDVRDFMAAPAIPSEAETEEQLARLKPEEAGERIGNCRLIEQIGEGGFGTVWLAAQEHPVQREVALKLIKLGMDTREVIARFEQERQALAVMDHPNIAKVYDAGATRFGRPYFVMELVRGTRLTDYCDAARLPTRERVKLLIQVCQAVQHAHQKGIIHRDLKPSNILVTLHDGMPVPKVIDFGVAKATRGRLTEATIATNIEQLIGTPLYMSPEQAGMDGVDVDTRSDIYSLGVLLYEMLTGQTPFNREEVAKAGYLEMRRLICESEPRKPSTALQTMAPITAAAVARRRQCEPSVLIHTVRGDLDWIAMKAIEKDRARRYETANGLALDLQRYLADEPVTATPPSRSYRFRKFARRHKLVLSAGAAVFAALVLGLIASLWQANLATRAKAQAVLSQKKAESEAKKAEASELRAKRISYATDMSLVQEALRANNIGLARQLLDRHRPANGEADLRNWEWRYLYQECRSGALAMLSKREGVPVLSASFSPDGRLLLVGYSDGRVELWDIETRKLRKLIQPGGQGARAAFSPLGESFAATRGQGVVKTVEVKKGDEKTLCKVEGIVRDLAYSRDGEWLAVLSRAPDLLMVVRVADGAPVMNYPLPAGGGAFFNNVRISPNKERLYISYGAFEKPAVRCVKVSDSSLLWERPIGLVDEDEPDGESDLGFSAMDLSPDGRTLVVATGYRDSQIHVLDVEGEKPDRKLKGHTNYVLQVAFSQDGRVLASTSQDQTVRLWNTATGAKLTAPLRGHNLEVNALAISADGHFLASGNKDGEVLLWDTRVPPPMKGVRNLPPHLRRVIPLPISRMVLGESLDHRWSLVDLLTFAEEPLPQSELTPDASHPRFAPIYPHPLPRLDQASFGLRGPGRKSAVSPDGKLLVVGNESGEIAFCDVVKRTVIKTVRSNLGSIFGVAFSPDGQRLVLSSGGDNGIEVWDVTILQKLVALSTNYSLVSGVEFSDDGNTLLSTLSPPGRSGKGACQFWHAPSFQEIEDAERAHGPWPQPDAFLPPTPAPTLAKAKISLEAEYRKRLGNDRPPSPNEFDRRDETLANLAELLHLEHRDDEAESLYSEILERLKKRTPQDDAALFAATKKLLTVVLSRMQMARQASDAEKLAVQAKQADSLVDEALSLQMRLSNANPEDTQKSLEVALLQVWFGKNAEHASHSRRLLEDAERKTDSPDPVAMMRAAAGVCLTSSGDPVLFERALRLADAAAQFAKGGWAESWFQQILGLAYFRTGQSEAAERALKRAADATEDFEGPERRYVQPMRTSVAFIRAMVLFRRGKEADARAFFAEAEPTMKQLPDDNRRIFESASLIEDLMVWLAYREAKVMLQAGSSKASQE